MTFWQNIPCGCLRANECTGDSSSFRSQYSVHFPSQSARKLSVLCHRKSHTWDYSLQDNSRYFSTAQARQLFIFSMGHKTANMQHCEKAKKPLSDIGHCSSQGQKDSWPNIVQCPSIYDGNFATLYHRKLPCPFTGITCCTKFVWQFPGVFFAQKCIEQFQNYKECVFCGSLSTFVTQQPPAAQSRKRGQGSLWVCAHFWDYFLDLKCEVRIPGLEYITLQLFHLWQPHRAQN